MLGNAQEEMDKTERRIAEVEELLKSEEGVRKKVDEEAERLCSIGSNIEKELENRRLNENHAAEMAAKLKREAELAEQGVRDLKG